MLEDCQKDLKPLRQALWLPDPNFLAPVRFELPFTGFSIILSLIEFDAPACETSNHDWEVKGV